MESLRISVPIIFPSAMSTPKTAKEALESLKQVVDASMQGHISGNLKDHLEFRMNVLQLVKDAKTQVTATASRGDLGQAEMAEIKGLKDRVQSRLKNTIKGMRKEVEEGEKEVNSPYLQARIERLQDKIKKEAADALLRQQYEQSKTEAEEKLKYNEEELRPVVERAKEALAASEAFSDKKSSTSATSTSRKRKAGGPSN